MSDTERRYSQIEKEALALVWSCRKFSNYILGKHIRLETDHKPLIPLLGKANLDSLPPRILRFRLHLSRFDYSISHVPGKLLYTADTLSRAPITSSSDCFDNMDMESFLHAIVSSLPLNPDRLEVYRQAQKADPIFPQIIVYCNQGWPGRHRIEEKYRSYWKVRSELSIVDDLLLFGTRIVVPKSLQAETLSKIHYGHQGIHRCLQRVSSAVWWPGVAKQVETFVKSCPQCLKTTPPPTQPLLQIPLPSHPWERVAADLFELKKTTSFGSGLLFQICGSPKANLYNLHECNNSFKVYFLPAWNSPNLYE